MAEQRKRIEPPISVAAVQAVKGIRQRMVRQAAAGFTIVLAIALFAGVNTSRNLGVPSEEEILKTNWLTFLSILMCVVGITNSMLISVAERYREIGTLKCLGATNSFIIKTFIIEALMIGFLSSVAGAVLGSLVTVTARGFSDGFSSLQVGGFIPGIAGQSVLLGTTIAVVSAIIPACQAAQMPAAAALRVEI